MSDNDHSGDDNYYADNAKPGWTWSHVAVLAAVTVAFGTLAWNIAGGQS